ncbi:hypothetical protein [Natronorubrum daqingense]|uniref:Uncharacterized protein n=1 Tax=Natronorubrum daqingense TaxID=588898 RepID=A0A1N7F642_9EURY|nr:hypothetical protein [Natronorubrum daqingense]APX97557.1 hypothetical protein BB347_13590 [Natronorubrum daqingense]SIR95722.1 hypothetical protein SAMN05421809_3033 [Natronorubrum daqingense]
MTRKTKRQIENELESLVGRESNENDSRHKIPEVLLDEWGFDESRNNKGGLRQKIPVELVKEWQNRDP